MCPKCGQATTQQYAGMIHFIPCSCKVDITERMKRNRQRIDEAYEKLGVKNG